MTADPAGHEHEINLRRLLLFRVVTATALLLPALYSQFLVGTQQSLVPIHTTIAVIYGVCLLYVLAQRAGMPARRLLTLQLTIDVALVTLLVHVAGGARSPLVFLYLVLAIGAGVMTGRQTALAIACLTAVSYGLLIHLRAVGWMPSRELGLGQPGPPVTPPEMYLRILMLLFAACMIVGLASSYTDRLRRARAALRKERSALEALQQLNHQLLAGMSSGLIAADPEGRVIACNRAAERITERPERELVGLSAGHVLGLGHDVMSDLDERLNEQQIYRTERQIQVRSGEYRTVGMSITRVVEPESAAGEEPEAGEPDASAYFPTGPWAIEAEGPMAGGYIFMFQDLSDIKRMERMFWMRERMAVLGEMAGSLAHEIRNPLASISGSLQMLRSGDVGTDTPRARRLMDIVTKESERLSKIIENFLDYARPETLEAADTDLVTLARDTVDLLENSPEVSDRHSLTVGSDADAVHALIDPERVQQVFWNLARNAIQAMPDGGSLQVFIRRRPGGAEVVFADDGVGMPPDRVDRIFRPFVSEKLADSLETGTGLGLAMVYRIMEQHGARIEVESEVGKGSRFVLIFEDAATYASEQTVVVKDRTERETQLFGELSRAVRADG